MSENLTMKGSSMERATIRQEITRVKIAHKRWVERTDHLISGLPVKKELLPSEATSCTFGTWLYSQGSQLRIFDVVGFILDELESHHVKIHNLFTEIYRIYFTIPQNKSFLHKLITFNSKRVSRRAKQQAQIYFEQLQKYSDEILKLLEELDTAITQITSKQLQVATTDITYAGLNEDIK